MAEFLQSQLDYVFFVYGLAFLVLATACLALRRIPGERLPWGWLALFGLIHGANEWLDMLAISLGDSDVFGAVRTVVIAASFLCLLEFARSGLAALGHRVPGRWVLVPLAALACLGGLAGLPGLNATSRYVLGFTGSVGAGLVLLGVSRLPELPGRAGLKIAGVMFLLYAVASGGIGPKASFPPACWFNHDTFFATFSLPVQMVRTILAIGAAAAIRYYLRGIWAARDELNGHRIAQTISTAAWLVMVLLMLGWGLTFRLERQAARDTEDALHDNASMLTWRITDRLESGRHYAASLAYAGALATAAATRQPEDLDRANSILDRFRGATDTSVCYLLDTKGVTVASSNRAQSDSFVGKSYAFRPYFREAMAGGPGQYFAVGATSLRRGFYTSAPVRDAGGRILGVAVVKQELDEIEDTLARSYGAFLVDPNGIVFLSSRPELRLASLWPVSEPARKALLETRQFGGQVTETVLPIEVVDGITCLWNGERLLAHRCAVGPAGWSLVLFSPTERISLYRLFGIVITLVLCTATLGFSLLLRTARESEARVMVSERQYHSLVESSPNWVALVGSDGRCLTINRSGKEAFGLTEAAVTGKPFRDFWPEDARPRVDQAVATALGGSLCSFEAEACGTNGARLVWHVVISPVTGAAGGIREVVSIANNITARQRSEEQLRKTMTELQRFNRLAVGREHRMLELKAEVNDLARRAGVEPPYAPDFTRDRKAGDEPAAEPVRAAGRVDCDVTAGAGKETS